MRYRSQSHTPPISPDGKFALHINWLSRQRRHLHNHPSGDPTPSRADIEMTKEIVAIARPLGIAVHDHIIVGKDGHASLKGMGVM